MDQHPSERARRLAAIEQAVATLRPRDREVFLASRVGKQSYDQIAATTGLTNRQVRRRCARALYEIVRHVNGRRPPWWRRLLP